MQKKAESKSRGRIADLEVTDNKAVVETDDSYYVDHQISYEEGTQEREVIELIGEKAEAGIDQNQLISKKHYEDEGLTIKASMKLDNSKKAGISTWKRKARSKNVDKTENLTSTKRKIEDASTEGKYDELDKSGKKTKNTTSGNQSDITARTGTQSRKSQ